MSAEPSTLAWPRAADLPIFPRSDDETPFVMVSAPDHSSHGDLPVAEQNEKRPASIETALCVSFEGLNPCLHRVSSEQTRKLLHSFDLLEFELDRRRAAEDADETLTRPRSKSSSSTTPLKLANGPSRTLTASPIS